MTSTATLMSKLINNSPFGLNFKRLSKSYQAVHSFFTLSSHLMPAYDSQFSAAKERLNSLHEEPDNVTKLKIYALFKQATKGRCGIPKPGVLDFVGKAKWDAWSQLDDLSQDDAQLQYVNLIDTLAGSSSSSPSSDTTVQSAAADDTHCYEGLKVKKEGNLFRVQFDRPSKKNALTWQMYKDVASALKEAAEDEGVSVAVITGTGDYYCSGNDLSNFMGTSPDQIPDMASKGKTYLKEFVAAFIDFPKPLIALVNGPAVGISVTTLALCDTVYCTDRATFHAPFSQLGQSPEGCSSYLFPKMMGNAKAGEILFFNKKITAHEAMERNLVTRVFPDDVFHQETELMVKQYASFPPQSMHYSKILNRASQLDRLHDVNEAECERLVERWQSEECHRAIATFFSGKKASL